MSLLFLPGPTVTPCPYYFRSNCDSVPIIPGPTVTPCPYYSRSNCDSVPIIPGPTVTPCPYYSRSNCDHVPIIPGPTVTPCPYYSRSNCDSAAANELRRHYRRPYFLPETSESSRLDWIFMGTPGFGAHMHVRPDTEMTFLDPLRNSSPGTKQNAHRRLYKLVKTEIGMDSEKIFRFKCLFRQLPSIHAD